MSKISYQRELTLISTRIIPEQDKQLDDYARRVHRSKQSIIQAAINMYLTRHGYPNIS